MPPTRDEVSAGGVILRRRGDGSLEAVLIATRSGERWGLPKGLVNKNEPLPAAALREVREETGLEAEIVAPLEPVQYWFWWGAEGKKVRHHKTVHFFVMRATGGDTANHDHEVDEARWFPVEEAVRQVTFASDRKLIEEAARVVEGLI